MLDLADAQLRACPAARPRAAQDATLRAGAEGVALREGLDRPSAIRHDDAINAAAGALVLAGTRSPAVTFAPVSGLSEVPVYP